MTLLLARYFAIKTEQQIYALLFADSSATIVALKNFFSHGTHGPWKMLHIKIVDSVG